MFVRRLIVRLALPCLALPCRTATAGNIITGDLVVVVVVLLLPHLKVFSATLATHTHFAAGPEVVLSNNFFYCLRLKWDFAVAVTLAVARAFEPQSVVIVIGCKSHLDVDGVPRSGRSG